MSRMIGRTLTPLALTALIALTGGPLAAQTPEISVTPDGEEWTVLKGQTNVLIVFGVENLGGTAASLTFTCTGTNGLSCDSVAPASTSLGAYDNTLVRVRFSAPSYAIVGTITLVARYQGQWIDSGVYVVTVEGANPTVSPDGGTLNAVVGPGPDSAVFVIHNAGYVSGEVSFSCSSRGWIACGPNPASITLGAGQQDTVVQTFNGLYVGLDTLTFTASSDGKSDTGYYVVTVTSSGSTPKVLPDVPSVFFEVESDTTERKLDFAVVNESGQGAGTYVLTCVPSGPWTELDAGQKRCEVTPEDTIAIAEGDTLAVEVRFKTLGGITGTGTIRVTATVQGDPAKTAWGQTVVEVGYAPDTLGGAPPLVQAVFPPSTIAVWDSGSVTFTVENKNEGNDTVYYALECRSSGRVACVPDEIGAWIPDGYQAQTQVELWGVHEGVDTLRYIATDTVADVADTATVVIQAIGAPGVPHVTPKGGTAAATADVPDTLAFTVANDSTGTATYSLSCTVDGGGGCSAPGQATVPPDSAVTVTAVFTPPDPGTYTLRLVASNPGADTAWYVVSAGKLTVQPKGDSTQVERGQYDTLTFEVQYTDTLATLTVAANCDPALSSCQESTSSLSLGSGSQTTASISVAYGPASQAGDAWVSLVVTRTGQPPISDSGWVKVKVIDAPGPPSVLPKGDTLYYPAGQGAQPRFTIANQGTGSAQYSLTCSLSGVQGGCGVQPSVIVPADSTSTVSASVTPDDTLIHKVTLRASGVPPLDSGWVFVRPVQLRVTPKGLGPRRVVQADSTFLQTFTVHYRGPQREITLHPFQHGVVTNCTAASSVSLGFGTQLGDSTSVQVECEAGDQLSTGRVGLLASTPDEPAVADSGWVDVRLPMSLTVDDANPGLEELRGECLSIAAGAGAIECDDFRYVYPFLPVKRLNRVRNIGLEYISAAAHRRKVIGANLLIEGGSAVQSVKGLLSIDGIDVDSILHQDSIPRNKATRFAFEVPEPPASGPTVVPYEVRMVVTREGSPPSVDTLTAEGRYLQVDRTEEFGRGWWPTGYEGLTPVTDTTLADALLWTGGDGSARVYVRDKSRVQADTPWVAWTRGVADTIREGSFVVPGTVGGSAADTARYLDLNGSEGGTISAGQHSGLTGASKMTWAFWLRGRRQSGRIGGVYASGDPNRVWWFEADDSGRNLMVVLFNASVGEPVFRTTTDTAFADTTSWHFVVAQFDGTRGVASDRLSVWIDGTLRQLVKPDWAGNYALPTQIAAGTNSPFEWGKVSAYTPGFNGYLGETGIIQNVLSAEERSDWRTNGIDFSHPNLVAAYRWRGNLTDESSEDNDLGTTTIDSGDYFTTMAYPSRSASAGPAYPEGNVSGYVRNVLGGGEVRFDANGRHRATVDRNGNQTVFRHTQYGGETRLTSIELPTKAGPAPVYRFSYQPSTLRLSTLEALGGNGSWVSYTVKAVPIDGTSSFTLDSLVTPDSLRTGFDYDAADAGLMREVRDHRGARTQVDYTHGKVSEVCVVTTNPNSTAEMPYDAYSLAGAEAPVPADGVSALFDGARADVADTTRFYVTHWGGIRGIRDALGATTWLSRTEPEHPALVTAIRYPNQRVVSVTYGPGGLPRTVTDDTIQATTTYGWNLKWRRVTSILSPEGETVSLLYDPATGDRLRETLGIDVNQHTTHYTYDGLGLLTHILPPGYSSSTMHQLSYDDFGNLSVQTTPLGIETTAYNDATGLDTLVVSPIEGTLTRQTRTERDRLGRDTLAIHTNTKDSTWLHVHTGYNEQKDRTAVETWAWHPTEGEVRGDSIGWTYDQLGRMHQEISPAGMTYQYDLAGNVTGTFRGADTIPLQRTYYDALNRPDSVITREAAFSATSGYLLDIDSFPALTIPRNKAVFTYDPVTGDMRTANNRYARISRTYTPDGLVQTDTLHIRALADTTDFTTHTYVVGYRYDLNRRRTHIDHEGWLLGGDAGSTEYAYNALGFLESVTDPGDQANVFGYDAKDRLVSKRFPGTGLDTLFYDLDGRLVSRGITTALDSTGYFTWGMDYDNRDKLTAAGGAGSSGSFDYSGLGHLTDAIRHTQFGVVIDEEETFVNDGHGNVISRRLYPSEIPPDRPYLKWESSYDTHSRLEQSEEVWTYDDPINPLQGWEPDVTHYIYDDWGRREYVWKVSHFWAELNELNPPAELGALHREESRSYFGADDNLWFVQTSRDSVYYTSQGAAVDDSTWHRGAFETYWYDALGRRVLKNSYQGPPVCTQATVSGVVRCFSAVERYVWDGDQLLYEVRRADTLDVRNADSGDQTGEVVYVHAGEIDAPLGIIRNGTPIMLHRDWRGMYAFSTGTNGEHTSCVLEVPASCDKDDVDWPAGSKRAYLEPFSVGIGVWYGSLATSQGDASGLLYRRNRYYDPQAGQFTQADVIGIAGGLNLYGYANADPINFSDPFGLCTGKDGKELPDDQCRQLTAAEGQAVYDAAVASGEWKWTKDKTYDTETRICRREGDCTDFVEAAMRGVGLPSLDPRPGTNQFGGSSDYTLVTGNPQVGDVIVQGGHAGIFSGSYDARGRPMGLQNGGNGTRLIPWGATVRGLAPVEPLFYRRNVPTTRD